MFKSQGLLNKIPCPEVATCKRNPCCFSHIINAPISSIPSKSHTSPQAAPNKRPAAPLLPELSAKVRRTTVEHASSSSSRNVNAPQNAPRVHSPAASTSKLVAPSAALRVKDYTTASRIPHTNRMQVLKLFYEEFLRIYSTLAQREDLANRDATKQEHVVYLACSKTTYRNLAAQTLGKLKKRPKTASASTGVGTNEEVERRARGLADAVAANLPLAKLKRYTLTNYPEEAWKKEFVLDIPAECDAPADEVGNIRMCTRCNAQFQVKAAPDAQERNMCPHHWGRRTTVVMDGKKHRVWTCCKDTPPCVRGPHVFQDKEPSILHARAPFVSTSAVSSSSSPAAICALDCEMVYTTAGISLARVTVVANDGQNVLLDEFIKPQAAGIIDYNTRFSGITEQDLRTKAVLDISGLQQALGSVIHPKTILIGHGIENDLKAMRIIHPAESIIDTSVASPFQTQTAQCTKMDFAQIFPHPAGHAMRYSLRNLAKMHLHKFIQDEGFHDSKQDAQIALDLLRWRIKEDDKLASTTRG